MELLRGTAPKAVFYAPTDETEVTSVTCSVNGAAPVSLEPVETTDAWEAQLPYIGSDTNNVEVVWSFNIPGLSDTFDETFSYEAVTPYLTKQEIKAIYPTATDSEVVELEAGVRHIINSHTGQKFGYDKGKTLTVEGHGEAALRLPERLVVLSGVSTLSANLDPRAAIIVSDGWYLKKGWAAETSPRTSASQYWGDISDGVFNNNIYSDSDDGFNPGYNAQGNLVDPTLTPVGSRPGGVIVAPGGSGRATVWKNDYPFEISGDWGYKTIPAGVKEAARLLVNDYACQEIQYRDRYLESIKASDWRLQFNMRAWESTGNVRADQLLSEYVILDWAVI